MKIAWVHPSWRDLVIDHLADDDRARQHFLRNCSINGALLALSVAGGGSGDRVMPLLETDSDWDDLTDRVHDLVPELEPPELIGLLDALALTVDALTAGHLRVEAQALAGAVLTRVAASWNRSRTPIPLSQLEAWLTLASTLEQPPAPPELAITWTELLPLDAPALGDIGALERFADWLGLVELLFDHDDAQLGELGFPGQATWICRGFLASIATSIDDLDPRAIAPAMRAVGRIGRVMVTLSEPASAVRERLRETEAEPLATGPQLRPAARDSVQRAGVADVERVLRDL